MNKIHSIRQLYYEQGKTIPEIITETGHDRKTITKYLDMTDFNAPEPVTGYISQSNSLQVRFLTSDCFLATGILHVQSAFYRSVQNRQHHGTGL